MVSDTLDSNETVCIATITSAHGIRGLVKIKTHTEHSSDIESFTTIYSSRDNLPVDVKIISAKEGMIIAQVSGVESRNDAEALRGVDLYIARSELPKAPDNEYYYSDLVGLKVMTSDGTIIGTVVSISNYGAGDVIEIQDAKTDRTAYYPFSKSFIETVDLKSGVISVNTIQEEVVEIVE